MEVRIQALRLAIEACRNGEDVIETAKRFLAFLANQDRYLVQSR